MPATGSKYLQKEFKSRISTRYSDIKALIKDKCGLTELIVDNLVAEGKSKKVTVGLADEGDAALMVRNINGMYVGSQQLYVEDARQKKPANQPYQAPPPPMPNNQYGQGQYNQYPQASYENQQYYMQQMGNPPFSMPPQPPAPNFGVPYYMASQNPNVGNEQQGMVQYPVHLGSTSNDPYQRRGNGTDREYGGGNREQSRPQTQSLDRDTRRDRSPRERTSRWDDSDRNRSDDRRGDRSSQRNYDRYDTDQSYKNNRSQDSFQGRSNQSFGSQQSNRYDKASDRSVPVWDNKRYDAPGLGQISESCCPSDARKADMPQRYGKDQYTQSRQPGNVRQDNVSRNKRAFDMPDNRFGPQSKKFGTDQQYNAKKYPESSGGQYSKYKLNNVQNKNKFDPQNRAQRQPNKPQQNRPQMQQNKPFMQPNKPNFNPKLTFPQNRPENPKNRANAKGAAKPPPTPERHEAWRVQASSVIANEILSKAGRPNAKRDPLVIQLKACVRARMDVILGEDMTVGLNDMLLKYREKHDANDDQIFFKGVMAKVDKAQQEVYKEEQKEGDVNEGEKPKPKSEMKPKVENVKPAQGGPSMAEIPELPEFSSNNQRLPKYPKSSKKLANQLKKAQKEEFINVSLYNLGPVREKILNEELDKICKVYKSSVPNQGDEVQKSMYKFLVDIAMPDLRKLLTLHVKKRVLNVRTNLSVRVYCQPKPPKRDAMDEYLKKFGVISLKKSATKKNLFVATCDTYENFDALCKQGSTVIDTLTLLFKPLQIMGPPKNFANIKKKMAKMGMGAVQDNFDYENMGDDAFEGDEQNDDVEYIDDDNNEDNNDDDNDVEYDEDENDDSTMLNTSDVVLLEEKANSNDVIVIDESDDKIAKVDNETVSDEIVDKKDDTGEDNEVVIVNDVVAIDEENTNANETNTAINDEVVAIDEEKNVIDNENDANTSIETVVINDDNTQENTETKSEENTVGDNAKIAEDDLEDF